MVNLRMLKKKLWQPFPVTAFLVRGLSTDLKHVNSYYFTRDLALFQMMPLYWKSASVLELSKDLVQDLKCDVVYASFISLLILPPPPPHLMKTAHNRLYNSMALVCAAHICGTMANFCCFVTSLTYFYSDQ